MSLPTPYKVTDEDLAALDGATREAMQPLLGALNVTLGDLVRILGKRVADDNLADEVRTVTLTTQAAVADAFPLKFTTAVERPRMVVLANCAPKDSSHTLAAPFVAQGFGVTDEGLVSVPWITGLLPDNTYSLTFWIR